MYREISHSTGKSIEIVIGPTAHKKQLYLLKIQLFAFI
jgi:hypothetical protein